MKISINLFFFEFTSLPKAGNIIYLLPNMGGCFALTFLSFFTHTITFIDYILSHITYKIYNNPQSNN